MIIFYVIAIVATFNLWALLQIFLRHWIYGARLYKPMILNVALSWLPNIVLLVYLITTIVLTASTRQGWIAIVTMLVFIPVWLLLLPNANYLITELNLNHRRDNEKVPMWYDIISVLTLALTGVLNAVSSIMAINIIYIISLRDIATDNLLAGIAHDPVFWLTTVGAILLSSFGIYIGRYIRVNSWDVKHPLKLLKKIWHYVVHERHLGDALLFVLFFSAFLFLMYLLFIAPAVALLGVPNG
jgi:uncharacterized membrane protein